ncbi:MAG: polysaccharide deacetylase family protein [Ginsengibacter sp.]
MKKIFWLFCLQVILSNVEGQQNSSASIARWKDSKKAALSLTFDDCINGQFTVALPLLNQYNFKSTFFLTIKNVQPQAGGWGLIQQAARDGHEIANHTMTHPFMHNLLTDSMAFEFDECNRLIKQNIPFAKAETMAYPYGDGGDSSAADQLVRDVAYKYFIAARAVQYRSVFYNEYDFAKTNDDYYRVNSEMIVDSNSIKTFPQHLDSTIKLGAWYAPTYHGIENGWLIVKKEDFEKQLQQINERKDLLWIAPFVNVIKYIKERSCANIKIIKDEKHKTVLRLTDTLNNSTWNEPLTINVKLNGKVKRVMQNKKSIMFSIINNTLTFDAVPGKDIIIKR